MTSLFALRCTRRAIVDSFATSASYRLNISSSVRCVTLKYSNQICLRAPTPHHQNYPRRYFSSTRYASTDDMAPKEKSSFNLKVPKGTKDWAGSDALLRDRIFTTIADVFKRHGGTALDTPVFELREILAGKYGEDSKLIYDLQDQGGEICSLRYDLTVPFARWLAMNPDVRNIKRYHIAKVYRRDQPAVSKGRMREFYQCDFDIAGAFDPMVPDAEVLRIVSEVFEELGWTGRYTIKVNHRKILDGVFAVCGVPEDKIRPISSAVDKLDKMPWADVRKEMVDEKGLDGAIADRIETYVMNKGSRELLEKLLKDEALAANESAVAGLQDMSLMMDYLEAFGALDKISFDMSLARGLDYYTGVIYEVVTEGSAPAVQSDSPEAQKAKKSSKKGKPSEDDDRSNDPTLGVGSVAAGGRYDNLVGMFQPKAQIPCVGISFGVDRIFSITKARLEREQSKQVLRPSEVDAYVMAFGGKGFTGLLKERMQITQKLWNANIKAEFSYKVKPKLPQQFKAAEQGGIPFGIILGEEEWAAGKVRVKEMGLPEGHPEKDGVEVELASLVPELQKRLDQKKSGSVASLAEQLQGTKV
ncbi:Histidine-tRNA ligase/ATP phosphoribosyltransferase regulatory subunit [Penicillium taxi]|uniref:Histidine-tRNA ligase/ATP phosphoribosyltransferase regulatory subunit n=1 Tax=Penicillium taxi TaxID=168475 RepID=UPI002545802B|nr:Histidine-tRNA ligase/ATP phosphoribosyltransferase regulatory subunit [Penicillium taxi]KAJ5898971.1 Histidine-tRNA ligase/ATP phosphoribosyltransferase regulatory subunit [Penicillium taxi]